MKPFKIRCSAIGLIMAGAIGLTEAQTAELAKLLQRQTDFKAGVSGVKALTPNMEKKLEKLIEEKKNPQLPAGAKTYCELWLKQKLYERKKEFSNKYTEKGDWTEKHSLSLIAEHLQTGPLSKCDEYMEDEFIHGTADVVLDGFGLDAKNPWDCFTFPLFDDELTEDLYWWQAQGYMRLYDKPLWKVVYVLSDTPEHLIKNEARQFCYKNGVDLSPEIMDDFRIRMTYGTIPAQYRVKAFDVQRDDDAIKQIELRVKMCREYINKIITDKKIKLPEPATAS